jgi:carbamoyltransferase
VIIKDKKKALEVILNKNPLGFFYGESEWGPRALGNRSLLFDPRIKDANLILNKLKNREFWQPFGVSMLLEHVHEWFDIGNLKESPYMSYAVIPKQNAIKYVPSVIHVNNTCRIQTVTKKQNKPFYEFINLFYKKTKVPMLINTSLNLAGQPIAETLEEAKKVTEYIYAP